MPNSTQVREIEFSNSRNGYNKDEVDSFLDLVEQDYTVFEQKISELTEKLAVLTKENEQIKVSQSSIQTLLVSAQKLADEITDKAKAEAQSIINSAKADAEIVLHEGQTKQIAAEQAAKQIIADAAKKSEGMITAAHDSVARQQILFDDLKNQISQFKNFIKEKYKEHIELLAQIPDSVSSSASEAANNVKTMMENNEIIAAKTETREVNAEPDNAQESSDIQPQAESEPENVAVNEEAAEPNKSEGFKVKIDFGDETDDNGENTEKEPEEEITFAKSKYFGKLNKNKNNK